MRATAIINNETKHAKPQTDEQKASIKKQHMQNLTFSYLFSDYMQQKSYT